MNTPAREEVSRINAKPYSELTDQEALFLVNHRFGYMRIKGANKQVDVLYSYRQWYELRERAKKVQQFYDPPLV